MRPSSLTPGTVFAASPRADRRDSRCTLINAVIGKTRRIVERIRTDPPKVTENYLDQIAARPPFQSALPRRHRRSVGVLAAVEDRGLEATDFAPNGTRRNSRVLRPMNVDGSRVASRKSRGRIGRSAPSAARRRSDCDHGARPGPLDCPRRRAPRRCCCGVGAARGNAPGGLVGAAHRPTPVGVVDAFGPEQACRFSPRCTSPDVRGSSSRGAVTTGTSHVNRAERRARWVPQQRAAELS